MPAPRAAAAPGRTRRAACLLLSVLLAGAAPAYGAVTLARRGVLLWQVQLRPDQCGRAAWRPCYNVYAVNQTQGDLVWFAFTTASSAIKAMASGHHSAYYTTWSGPGLYAINALNGHVRWQFPLNNWFRYWIKDIDLDSSASFAHSAEVREVVYVTAAGPPARLYGLRTKSGSKLWEFKLPDAAASLADLAGPLDNTARGQQSTVFLAFNLPPSNSSWLQALDTCSGAPLWRSAGLNATRLSRLELDDGRLLATAAATDGGAGGGDNASEPDPSASIAAFSAHDGTLLWQRRGPFCATPSPIASTFDGTLLLAPSCANLSGLTALDAASGAELWSGWSPPPGARPDGSCSHFAVHGGSVFFGCSCSISPSRRWQGGGGAGSAGDATARLGAVPGPAAAGSAPAGGALGAGAPAAHPVPGLCLYSLSLRSGRLRWALPVPGDASLPEGAKAWGLAPLVRDGLAVLPAADRLIAADATSGRLRWSLALPRGELLQPWQAPSVEPDSGTLLLAARVSGANRSGLAGVALRDGQLLWHRSVNGTAQPPLRGPAAGGEPGAWVSGGRAYFEACRGITCCLRALNATSGRQHWGMCLDATQGDDATHPPAQFAIWLITLLTIGSIALLILGACLVYVHRWREEHKILYGGQPAAASYMSLPPEAAQDSDTEGDD